MIKLLRVDHRLLHGQVVFSWANVLDPDCMLVADDKVLNDELRKTTLKLVKPEGVKLVIKGIDASVEAINSGKTDKYKLMIIVSNVTDAVRLAKECPQVTAINLGGTKATSETHSVSKMVNLTDEEERLLQEVAAQGTKVFIQAVPSDPAVAYKAK